MTSVAEPLTTPTTVAPSPEESRAELGSYFVGRRYVQLVLVLGLLSAIGPLTIDTYLPALPELSSQLGATDAQAQLTITGLLVGLGLGQLVIGPLSDAIGRRKPLLWGLAGHAVMSVLCALAPSITLLAVTRTLQGVAGAAVAVVAMAIVRDVFSGIRAAQLLSRLILVLGIAPILAPSLGSALMTFTSWRGIFLVLAGTAVALFALAVFGLRETLPVHRRQAGTVRGSLRAYRTLFTDRLFVAMVLVAGLMFATLMAYISGAPFLLQGSYGLTPQQFGLAFGVNAVGLIVMTQVNPTLVRRYSPVGVLTGAVVVGFLSAVALLVTGITGTGGLWGFMLPLFFLVGAAGLGFPNAPAIALNRHGEAAGTAAALLGASQFLIGGLVVPSSTSVPMAGVLLGTTGLALVIFAVVRRELNAVSYA